MGLKKFQAAFDALPDNINGDDLADFFAGVAVSYMPPEDAIRTLLVAAKVVSDYAADTGDTECNCQKCTAERAAQTKH